MLANAIFNLCEAGLWALVAIVLIVVAVRSRRYRPVSLIAAAAFAVFGVTDVIEAHTGSYWEPLWLFLLKGACVLCFLGCIIAYYCSRRAEAGASAGRDEEESHGG